MTTRDFNSFLMDKHQEDYQGTDDDAPDLFESWKEDLDWDMLQEYLIEFMDTLDSDSLKIFISELI